MEYSTISMLDDFQDTLTNLGIHEAWIKQEWNDVTQIKNKCVKCESNWKKLSQIQ